MEQQTSLFRKLLDLREGAQTKEEIIENVKDDTEFSSARVWVLVCAVVLASVGLNMNSVPVIIGAMLISPLMGPIVSVGLALATEDWGLMRRSGKNLFTQTVISILISSLYFTLTPISNAQSELLARIQPTLFDVLIAIFGGLAGFIGISRARQNNIVPGVAIATALMPPLCTVGYGVGTMQPKFIIGAFYLFLINSIFICLSSLVVATYLRLPKKQYSDSIKKTKTRRIISIIIIAIILPAIYQAVLLVKQNNFNLNAERYIERVFVDQGYVVIYKNIKYSQAAKRIELGFLSRRVNEEELQAFQERLNDFNLTGTELVIQQNKFALTEEDWRTLLQNTQNDQEQMRLLEERLKSTTPTLVAPEQLLAELQVLENNVVDVAVGKVSRRINDRDEERIAILVYVNPGDSAQEDAPEIDEPKLMSWLEQRINQEGAEIIFIEQPTTISEES